MRREQSDGRHDARRRTAAQDKARSSKSSILLQCYICSTAIREAPAPIGPNDIAAAAGAGGRHAVLRGHTDHAVCKQRADPAEDIGDD